LIDSLQRIGASAKYQSYPKKLFRTPSDSCGQGKYYFELNNNKNVHYPEYLQANLDKTLNSSNTICEHKSIADDLLLITTCSTICPYLSVYGRPYELMAILIIGATGFNRQDDNPMWKEFTHQTYGLELSTVLKETRAYKQRDALLLFKAYPSK